MKKSNMHLIGALTLCLLATGSARAQSLPAPALVEALQAGGYVIAMRHAASPRAVPDAATAASGNVDLERQLDAAGRDSAAAMGAALERLDIRVDPLFSSPTFRAVETVRQLGVGEPQTVAELDSRQRDDEWLRARANESPSQGSNVLIVTHSPNLGGAFGEDASGMADGETLILEPSSDGPVPLARVAIEDWPALAHD